MNLAKTTWSANKYMTSHFEGYAHALYEEEINAEDLQYRREKKMVFNLNTTTSVDSAK